MADTDFEHLMGLLKTTQVLITDKVQILGATYPLQLPKNRAVPTCSAKFNGFAVITPFCDGPYVPI